MLNSKTDYYMTSQEGTRKIQETKLEKDLGAIVTDNLKPASHCQKATRRGMTALHLMKASFDRIDIVNFRMLFTTCPTPSGILYASNRTIWHTLLKTSRLLSEFSEGQQSW